MKKGHEKYRTIERNAEDEDPPNKIEYNAEQQAGEARPIRTSPGARNTNNFLTGGREDKDVLGSCRELRFYEGTHHNAKGRGAHRESCASEIQMGRIRRKVSHLGKGCTRRSHHLSGSGRATCHC
jgi:hypothetical protein